MEIEDEDEYSLIENQLEKQRRLKLKEVTNQQPEAYIKSTLESIVPKFVEKQVPEAEIEIISNSHM
jgi:hypothetical protein